MTKKIFIAILILAIPIFSFGRRGEKFYFFISTGPTFATSPAEFSDSFKMAPNRNLGVAYNLSGKLAITATVQMCPFNRKDSAPSSVPDLKISMTSYQLGLKYLLTKRKKNRPYLLANGGMARTFYLYHMATTPQEPSEGLIFHKLFTEAGIGLEFFNRRDLFFFIEIKYKVIFHKHFSPTSNTGMLPISLGIAFKG